MNALVRPLRWPELAHGVARRVVPCLRPLGALCLPLLLTACEDWPHFDYADVPPKTVSEVESEGQEVPQNLSRLYGEVTIIGFIEKTGYQLDPPNDPSPSPFGLKGYYYGDMDWFQFLTWERFDQITFELSWDEPDSVLDLYFFWVSPDGAANLISYEEAHPAGLELDYLGLDASVPYAFAVAGREGSPTSYELTLHLSNSADAPTDAP